MTTPLYAPWRRAYLEGEAPALPETPTGCLFCDHPRAPGPQPDEGGAARDRERLVVTCRPAGAVFINRFPYNPGHVLIAPHAHVATLEGLGPEAWQGLAALVREVTAAVRAVYAPDGLNVGLNEGLAAGASLADHLHWHVVPRWAGDVNFLPALTDTKVIAEALDTSWQRLAEVLRRPEEDA